MRPIVLVVFLNLVALEVWTMPILQNINRIHVPPGDAVLLHHLLVSWILSFEVVKTIILFPDIPIHQKYPELVEQQTQAIGQDHCEHREGILQDLAQSPSPPNRGRWQHTQDDAPHAHEGSVAVLRVIRRLAVEPQHHVALPDEEKHRKAAEATAHGAAFVGQQVEGDESHRWEYNHVRVLHPQQQRHKGLKPLGLTDSDASRLGRLFPAS
mmetsp:Transcript_111313/g.278720  ORF Transcript_111313/g.278720 Transcript_111313/m.278720 type:complete len:211 (+) Transcript_111313:275-907(+)